MQNMQPYPEKYQFNLSRKLIFDNMKHTESSGFIQALHTSVLKASTIK